VINFFLSFLCFQLLSFSFDGSTYDLHSAGVGVFNRWQLRLHGTNITDTPPPSRDSDSYSTNATFPPNSTTTEYTPTASSSPSLSPNSPNRSNSLFDLLSSLDRSMTLLVIVALTVGIAIGWYPQRYFVSISYFYSFINSFLFSLIVFSQMIVCGGFFVLCILLFFISFEMTRYFIERGRARNHEQPPEDTIV
jgi:hypothetical protein